MSLEFKWQLEVEGTPFQFILVSTEGGDLEKHTQPFILLYINLRPVPYAQFQPKFSIFSHF